MYQHNVQLKPYNSFQTEAIAKVFCEPSNIHELKQSLVDYPNEEKLILGSGCNLFFTKDFNGLVIRPRLYGIREISMETTDSEHILLEVKASEDWDDFVKFCVEKGCSGLENLSYIPGTVGASPVQNIGAYGVEVKDCIHEVTALNTKTLEITSFSNIECQFAYRDSYFKRNNNYIIVSVIFRLKRSYMYKPKYADLNKELEDVENPTIEDVREAVIRIRQRKLPDEKILPNAGSFFKNPYITQDIADRIAKQYPELPLYPVEDKLLKTSAAFLIDKAGFKGKQIGLIGTSPKQALIIVNYGSTDGNEIVTFMKSIQNTVSDKFGISLEPEVGIL